MLNALGCSAVTGPAVNTTEGKRRAFTFFFFFFSFLRHWKRKALTYEGHESLLLVGDGLVARTRLPAGGKALPEGTVEVLRPELLEPHVAAVALQARAGAGRQAGRAAPLRPQRPQVGVEPWQEERGLEKRATKQKD